ncbi:coiled-coil domain-containing protein 17 [Acanthochromis polyacanthus]|uniref:coiled-coil domain-containing protein 17 n=1 Tax=Acanthochromis polyacanthus TaxID=80966 RepID=UPI0022341946|nr:coiled-coil domain-containing protein 17 [Acanthochromis polyacanthus]
MEKELICRDCNMLFHSTRLLEKHKVLLCIGSEAGHIQAQRHSSEPLRRNKAGGVDPKQTRTPDLVKLRGQQRSKSRRGNVDAELKSPRVEDKAATCQRDSAALQNLTDEFHKLRTSIEENLPKWSKRTNDSKVGSTVSFFTHKLAHQVSILAEQSNTTHMERLLTELREQEERNKETLQQLTEHLCALHVREGSVPADQSDPHKKKKMHHDNYKLLLSVEGPLSSQIKALQQVYMQSGGSDPAVVTELIDLQAQAQSLEKDRPAAASKAGKKNLWFRLQICGKNMSIFKSQVPLSSLLSSCPDVKASHPSWELLVLEQENQRLEEEILRIQLARERHSASEAAVKTELELIQRENLHWISSVQAEMERRKEASRPRRQPPPSPLPLQPKNHIHAPLSLFQTRSFSCSLGGHVLDSSDSLGPAPYDPLAGFVVFYDMALGVDASQKALHLVSALYSKGQKVGPSTLLPAVQCLPGVPCPYPHSLTPGNNVLLSVKQHAPSIQPSPYLCLVVELQAARDLDDYNHEVYKLASCGWTRLELFDQHNQLHSGHWRVPVRTLPIRPSGSIAQLNSIPQVGTTELCVRLVNGRDGDVQTLIKPDPHSTSHYKYPPVESCLPASIHSVAAPPVSAPQPTGVHQLSSLLPCTDPKPPSPTKTEWKENM